MAKKVALITGVTGQDGSYLAEFLLKRVLPPFKKTGVRSFFVHK